VSLGAQSGAETLHCAELLRDHARARYLASLLAPPGVRPALFALYAFDHEISRVRRLVSEPMAGLIRFQWWRDAIDAIAAGRPAPAHPVAQALQQAWGGLEPSRQRLEAAIDARERELEPDAPATVTELERHLAATSAGPVLAALGLLGVDDPQSVDAGRRVGLAIGLADLLHEIERDRERARFLPRDVQDRHAITAGTIEEAASSRAFAPAIGELADLARDHLRQARRSRRKVARAALPALLPGVLVRHQLQGLAALGAKAPARTALAPLWLMGYRALGIF
jgi:phytoene/squalene synthetase